MNITCKPFFTVFSARRVMHDCVSECVSVVGGKGAGAGGGGRGGWSVYVYPW